MNQSSRIFQNPRKICGACCLHMRCAERTSMLSRSNLSTFMLIVLGICSFSSTAGAQLAGGAGLVALFSLIGVIALIIYLVVGFIFTIPFYAMVFAWARKNKRKRSNGWLFIAIPLSIVFTVGSYVALPFIRMSLRDKTNSKLGRRLGIVWCIATLITTILLSKDAFLDPERTVSAIELAIHAIIANIISIPLTIHAALWIFWAKSGVTPSNKKRALSNE